MKIGTNEISKIYLGSTEVGKAYLGSDVVFTTGSTPTSYTLPNVSYLCNYNAVDFDDDLQTFYRSENTQSLNKDLTRTYGSGTLALDGRKVAINSNWSSAISYGSVYENPFNITSNNQDLTVIYKAAPLAGTYDNQNNIIGNRGNNTTYNWMVRVMSFHNSVGEQMQFTPSVSPQTIVIRVHNGDGERYCVESEQIATQTGMDFSKQAASVGFFAGFGNGLTEPFKGDFYWLYVSREVLTDAQVQQVIDYNEHKEHIEPTPIDYTKEYFTLKALENGHFGWNVVSMLYSLNDAEWTTWPQSTGLDVSAGDVVRFKDNYGRRGYGNNTISSTGRFMVYGNSMSLFSELVDFTSATTFPSQNGSEFQNVFSGNTKVVSAKNLILPATTLNTNSYRSMFVGCTALISPPVISAATVADSACTQMFSGCTSLQYAPDLPATTVGTGGYANMFVGCTGMTTGPSISATTIGASACTSMFSGCSSMTVGPTSLPATYINPNAYREMFKGCASLTTAPTLSGTYLNNGSYYNMFAGCTSLTTAPELLMTNAPASSCTQMFSGCTGMTVGPSILKPQNPEKIAYFKMFYNCKSLVSAPVISATTIGVSGCTQMFNGCTSLSYVKCLATDISATDCTTNWVRNVSATGTFIKDPGMSSWTTGVDGIPSGWTVQNSDGSPINQGGESDPFNPDPEEEEW